MQHNDPDKGVLSYYIYAPLAFGWLLLAWYFSSNAESSPLAITIIGTSIIGAPILLSGIYRITIKRTHALSALQSDGDLHGLLKGRAIRVFFWIIYSIFAAFVSFFMFATFSSTEWAIASLAVVVLPMIYVPSMRKSAKNFKQFMATHKALQFSCWVSAGVLTAAYLLLLLITNAGENIPGTLTEILNNLDSKPINSSASLLAQYSIRYADFLQVIKDFALSQFSQNGVIFSVVTSLASAFVFFNVTLALTAFLIPAKEYRRIFNPLVVTNNPAPISTNASALASSISVILYLFIFVPTITSFEGRLRNDPELQERIESALVTGRAAVQKIEEGLYQPGTIEKAEDLKQQISLFGSEAREQLKAPIRSGFVNMRKNVEVYLNSYYSLNGEYARIGLLLFGGLAEGVERQINTSLNEGEPFADYAILHNDLIAQDSELRNQHNLALEKLLKEGEIKEIPDDYEITESVTLAELQSLPPLSIEVSPENRAGERALASAVGAIVATKVASSLAAKGTIKLAANALLKAALTKAAGGTAGGLIGGAAGSVVPVIGNVGGAVIGAAGGVGIGVLLDYGFLKGAEAFGRDDYEKRILIEIDELEIQMLGRLEELQ